MSTNDLRTVTFRQITVWNGSKEPVRFYVMHHQAIGLSDALMTGPVKLETYRYMEARSCGYVILNASQSSIIEVSNENIHVTIPKEK